MTQRETDLDRITTLLGQCLGRIDEQAYRLQRDEDGDDFVGDVLEQEAALLQELVGTLVEAHARVENSDLNRVVGQSVRDCVAELGVPVVVSQVLAPDLPRIACGPGQLAFAVQRAVMLALARADDAGDIRVTTRREGEQVVFELESHGQGRDRHLHERSATLCEFVAGLDGQCRIDSDDHGSLLIALELPAALAVDDR